MKRISIVRLVAIVLTFFSNVCYTPDIQAENFADSDTEAPWFHGWYTRIAGQDGSSIAIIGASQYLPLLSTEDNYTQGYLAVIVQDAEGRVRVYEDFPDKTAFWSNRESVLDDPLSSSWEGFGWCEIEEGRCTENIITNEYITAVIHSEELNQTIELDAVLGTRIPYNSNIPWIGPEGMVEFLHLVPLHWLVYSLGSTAQYSYRILDEFENPISAVEKASGYAHQESNWGSVFPPAWIWAEGIHPENSHQFVLSGGELNLYGFSLTTWMAAYHSPKVNWTFRPTLPNTTYQTTINACEGTFSITAADSIRKLEITAEAGNFFDLYVPTEEGFLIGAKESFSSIITIKAYVKLPWFGYVLIDTSTFNNAALEFGGDYMNQCDY